MRAKTVYICDVCNTEYNYQEEAEQCEDQPIIEPDWLKIGFEKNEFGGFYFLFVQQTILSLYEYFISV